MKCKLEDIVDVTMGQSPKSEYYNTEGKGYPFLQGNRTFGFKYPTFDTYTTVMTKPAKAGDVIMSVRAPVGDLNITPVDMCLGRGVCSLRMKNGNQDFLFYMMKYYIPHLLKKESGTVFGSVNRNDINGLEVNIPEDAQVQKEIARYLEMIDDKIELNNAINKYLGGLLMGQIQVEKNVGGIEGLCVITPTVHGDDRGYFMETYNLNDMKEAGLDLDFVQDNQSSSGKGVLRGLHYQKNFPQGKLVRVIRGSVFDVAVDLRKGSETYGKWYGLELSEENKKQFYIPKGFAHGYLVLSEWAEFCYKCTDFYHPGDDGGLVWNDPEIGITWPDVTGKYPGNGSSSGYRMSDGTPLNILERDENWPTLAKL